jgi:hypothetical protein
MQQMHFLHIQDRTGKLGNGSVPSMWHKLHKHLGMDQHNAGLHKLNVVGIQH